MPAHRRRGWRTRPALLWVKSLRYPVRPHRLLVPQASQVSHKLAVELRRDREVRLDQVVAMKRLIALFLVSGCIVLGQSDSNSITITATRTIYAPPDQVLFEVAVDSGLDASLDAVVAALAGSGITAKN